MKRRNFLNIAATSTVALITSPLLKAVDSGHLLQDDPKAFQGKNVFYELLATAEKENWKELPIGILIGNVAMALRGTPYEGATLELYDNREICSVNFLGLDCVTLFESSLGFARMLKTGGSTPNDLLEQITYTRYRHGKLTDYTSRLHYTVDWFYDNQEKGVVKIITQELPDAIRFTKTINFMSTHPNAYRQLKANPDFIPPIEEIEKTINSRTMYYIPKEDVREVEPMLQTGDIIGITTTIKGIDCSHTGLCYRDTTTGVLRYLHASLTHGKVMLDAELYDYLQSVTKHTGIMVVRPLEVS